jgi:deaminated glutathione amidase
MPSGSITGSPFTVACVQFTAGPDPEPNIAAVSDLIRRARDAGADFITTPEASNFIESGQKRREKARREADDPFLAAMRELARETRAWILVGSLVIDPTGEPDAGDETRLANRSFLLDAQGGTVAKYDKIHLFDIDLPNGESIRESNAYRPGKRSVIAETPWGKLGMTVCYDARFPHLYRQLAQSGADFLSVPSVFTVPTGKAHWEVLLRSRAIVDPWGEVVAEGGEGVGIITAKIDPSRVAKVRGNLPSLRHDRDFTPPTLTSRPLAAE